MPVSGSFQKSLSKDYKKIWSTFFDKHTIDGILKNRVSDRRRYIEILRKCIPCNRVPIVLEVGCGAGTDVNILKFCCSQITALATDIVFESTVSARTLSCRFDQHVNVFVSDTMCLPLRDQCADLVFSQGLVEHFPAPDLLLMEQSRVLRKGGFLIVNVPQKYTGYTIMKRRQMAKGNWHLGWEREFSAEDLRVLSRDLQLRERAVLGYQYWQSWGEPAFIFRDLYNKFHRRNPLADRQVFRFLRANYEAIWQRLEEKWGHLFMQNIVMAFEKH